MASHAGLLRRHLTEGRTCRVLHERKLVLRRPEIAACPASLSGGAETEQFEYASIASHAGLLRRTLTEGRICLALNERMQVSPRPGLSCPEH